MYYGKCNYGKNSYGKNIMANETEPFFGMQGLIQIFIGSNFPRINDLYICFQIRFFEINLFTN